MSILNQKYQNWELIFLDNNSNDKSAKIFEKYKDKRFFYFKNDVFFNKFFKFIYKPYHENRNKILYRSVVLMSEIDMKSFKL